MITVSALIPAAGKGKRFGSSVNKVFADLLGKPIIAHTLAAFQDCGTIDEIVLVVGEADVSTAEEIVQKYGPFDKSTAVVTGGEERGDSVLAGLRQVHGEIVAIHDGARPLVTTEIIEATIDAAKEFGAAVAAVPVIDTIKQADENCFVEATLDRSRLYQIQTPQTFRTQDILKAYEWAEREGIKATDDAAIYEKVVGKVKLVPGSYDNIKVTGPQDIINAECRKLNAESFDAGKKQPLMNTDEHGWERSEQLKACHSEHSEESTVVSGHPCPETHVVELASGHSCPEATGEVVPHPPTPNPHPLFRTGFGYDVHRLVPGRRLVLGGVEFYSPVGLLGHSDADVILHAISDALLGAAALGDIGKLFPDTDPAFKDADSLMLLSNVGKLLLGEGWVVVNIDVMMIGEKPKISPYTEKMKRNISGALDISDSSINIKATTSEGLGYIGLGEGICCYAVATISRK